MPPAPPRARKKPKSQKPVLAFPVTRSRSTVLSDSTNKTHASPSEGEDNSSEGEDNEGAARTDNGSSDDENEVQEGPESEGDAVKNQQYRRLGFKHVKDLKMAVTSYGPTAPFTLSLIENLSERWLVPNDWYFLARATLTGGDYMLWKTEFAENCREIALRNSESKVSKKWTR